MANTINIENGATIDELDAGSINDSTVFLVVTDGLTKMVDIATLRKAFASDGSAGTKNQTYYTATDIDKQISEIRKLINTDYTQDFAQINTRIDTLQSNINTELTAMKAEIKKLKDFCGL